MAGICAIPAILSSVVVPVVLDFERGVESRGCENLRFLVAADCVDLGRHVDLLAVRGVSPTVIGRLGSFLAERLLDLVELGVDHLGPSLLVPLADRERTSLRRHRNPPPTSRRAHRPPPPNPRARRTPSPHRRPSCHSRRSGWPWPSRGRAPRHSRRSLCRSSRRCRTLPCRYRRPARTPRPRGIPAAPRASCCTRFRPSLPPPISDTRALARFAFSAEEGTGQWGEPPSRERYRHWRWRSRPQRLVPTSNGNGAGRVRTSASFSRALDSTGTALVRYKSTNPVSRFFCR